MKTPIYTKDGYPCGEKEIPDEILESASNVRAWLESEPETTAICGLSLLERQRLFNNHKEIAHPWGYPQQDAPLKEQNDDLRKLAVKLAKTLCNTNVGGWAYSNNTSVDEILTALQSVQRAERVKSEGLRGALVYAEKACRCERFKTKGFDYHETHPVLGECHYGRWITPRDKIRIVLAAYEASEDGAA